MSVLPRRTRDQRVSTTTLLSAGALAGPLYVVVGAAQALSREGFDISRHPLSILANGDLGWIQIGNFVVAGGLTVAGAVGARRALGGGVGGTWGPRLLAGYGLGLVAAGAFRADPGLGFPPGTPAGPGPVSWHGMLHFVAGGIGFAAFVAACLVFARRWSREGRRVRALVAVVTGVLFLAAFAGIASGGGAPVLNLAFTAAVVLAWGWISATMWELRREQRS